MKHETKHADQGHQPQTKMYPTEGFSELVRNSYRIRGDVERETYSSYVPYVPTDMDYDGTKELFDGWDEQNGYCEKCFQLRAKNGSCDCC